MVSSVSMGGGARPDPAQFQAMRQQRFAKADGDGSGGLNLDEFKAMAKQGPGGAGGPGGPGGAKGPGGPPPVALSDEQLATDFKAWDTGGDASLTREELEAGFESKRASMSTGAFAQSAGGARGSASPSDAGQQLLALLQALGVGADAEASTSTRTRSVDLMA